jgi:hypothetical protein
MIKELSTATKLTDEILALTEAMVFTNKEADIDAYTALMSARQPLVDRLTGINLPATAKGSPQHRTMLANIEHIAALDKEHAVQLAATKAGLTAELKEARTGQKLATNYQLGSTEAASSRFDIKQ